MLDKVFKVKLLLTLAHILVNIQNRLTIFLVIKSSKASVQSVPLHRYGTSYGGWWLPTGWVATDKKCVLVSAGLGFDTSFDKSMLENGFTVIGLDPLVDCCLAADENLRQFSKVKIINKGLATFSGLQEFFEPKVRSHDSWSTINANEVEGALVKQFEVVSLHDLIKGHPEIQNASFRYLKMDIEGAELALLKESFDDIERFDFVGIEMDFLSLIPFLRLKKRLQRIREARRILIRFSSSGFDLVYNENFNFFWMKKS